MPLLGCYLTSLLLTQLFELISVVRIYLIRERLNHVLNCGAQKTFLRSAVLKFRSGCLASYPACLQDLPFTVPNPTSFNLLTKVLPIISILYNYKHIISLEYQYEYRIFIIKRFCLFVVVFSQTIALMNFGYDIGYELWIWYWREAPKIWVGGSW